MLFFNKKKEENRWLIVGLGNPGPEYSFTRHNCGYLVIDEIIKLFEKDGYNPVSKSKFKGKYWEIPYKDQKLVLLKPETYMNNSGESIQEAMHWYKLTQERLIVIYDDLDIEFGTIRVRAKGSAGTHNGMKSVIEHTDNNIFTRVRVGIGGTHKNRETIKFVLSDFTKEEESEINKTFQKAAEAVLCIIDHGTERAMSKYNG
ncbi:MAG: aminoacyl-tRNA hydrolase [Ruminococcaceae bacterium]|nr:aminoacyl-tRNA hydrolase [Oscillospiraceae bacterium]